MVIDFLSFYNRGKKFQLVSIKFDWNVDFVVWYRRGQRIDMKKAMKNRKQSDIMKNVWREKMTIFIEIMRFHGNLFAITWNSCYFELPYSKHSDCVYMRVFFFVCLWVFACFFSRSLKSFFFNGPRPTCVKFKNKTQSYLSYTQKIAMDSVDICRHFWSYDIVYIVDIVCMACFENKIQIWFALFSF